MTGKPEAAGDDAGGQGETPGATFAVREPYLVLVVDDDQPIAETLALIVEEAGYTAMVAPHGRAALALAQHRWPALVLTDLMMPYLPGDALIAALRVEAAARNLPMPAFVLLTAAGQRAANASGADRIIVKPFEIEQIDVVLAEMLGPPPAT